MRINGHFSPILLVRILAVALNFLIILTIARVGGPEVQGHFSTIVILSFVLSTFFGFSVDVNYLRFMSKGYNKRTLEVNSLLFILILMIPLLIFFFIYITVIFTSKNLSISSLSSLIFLIPANIAISFSNTLNLVTGNIRKFSIISLAPSLLMLLGISILISFSDIALPSIVWTYLIIYSLTLLYIFKSAKLRFEEFSFVFLKYITFEGLKNHTALVSLFIFLRLHVVLVYFYQGAVVAGYYAVAIFMCELVGLITDSYTNSKLPILASKDQIERREEAKKVIIRNLIFSLFLSLCLLEFGDELLTQLYSMEYKASYPFLQALLPGTFFLSVSRGIYPYMTILNRKVLNALFNSGVLLLFVITISVLTIISSDLDALQIAQIQSTCMVVLSLSFIFFFQRDGKRFSK